jgi:hypothetical protein
LGSWRGLDPIDDQYPSEGFQCGAGAAGFGIEGQTRSDGLDVDSSPDNNLFNLKPTLDGLTLGKPSISVGAYAGAYGKYIF